MKNISLYYKYFQNRDTTGGDLSAEIYSLPFSTKAEKRDDRRLVTL